MQNGSAFDLPFLDRQVFSALDMHGQLIAVLDSDTIAYSIAIKYLMRTRYITDKEVTQKSEDSMLLIKQFWPRVMNINSCQCKT
jgi:hypothetical protein